MHADGICAYSCTCLVVHTVLLWWRAYPFCFDSIAEHWEFNASAHVVGRGGGDGDKKLQSRTYNQVVI